MKAGRFQELLGRFVFMALLLPLQNAICPQSPLLATSKDEFRSEINRAEAARTVGQLASALKHYQIAAEIARRNRDSRMQAQALLHASGAEIRLFRYRSALKSAESARTLALSAGDRTTAGGAAINIGTVYSQLGANTLADRVTQEAVHLLENTDKKRYLVQALISAGDIQYELKESSSVSSFQRAALLASQTGMKDEQAAALDHLGQVLIFRDDLANAFSALNEAYALQVELRDESQAVTVFTLAQLAMKQGRNQLALQLLDRAVKMGGRSLSSFPRYVEAQLRGEILDGLGRRSEALLSLEKAVRLADTWRESALPGDMAGTQTTAALDDVYQDFVDLAARLSIERRDSTLARQALGVLSTNRAADLREQMVAALNRRMQLPPRYFELLSELQAAQGALLAAHSTETPSPNTTLQRVTQELAQLQIAVGIKQLGAAPIRPAKGRAETLPSAVQRRLKRHQLLLSFSLCKKRSFLWAVTAERLELYELPSAGILSDHAARYFAAIQKGSGANEGALVSRDLFSHLPPELARKAEWLIEADGILLDQVPFAALPATYNNLSKTLVAIHSLRFLPSQLLLLNRTRSSTANRFVGVADPVYNNADSRSWNRPQPGATTIPLARLAGSGVEVRAAARLSGLSSIRLLTGLDATESKLRIALQPPTSILHFAVHVLRSASKGEKEVPGTETLALSLDSRGIPELLTKEAIAAGLRVPGALVVLDGCASQRGEIVAGAGLIGLSRAWLLAGAVAVIATSWPTPDDSGTFFSEFYKRLSAQNRRTVPLVQGVASALQQTQLAMQHSAGDRSSPSFWASYSVFSSE